MEEKRGMLGLGCSAAALLALAALLIWIRSSGGIGAVVMDGFERAQEAVKPLMALQEEITREFRVDSAHLNVHHGAFGLRTTLTVGLAHPAFPFDAPADPEGKARRVARFVRDRYENIDSVDRIRVELLGAGQGFTFDVDELEDPEERRRF